MQVNIKEIHVKYNPRTKFEGIEDLAKSIKRVGLMQPLTVTKNGKGYIL